MTGRRVWWYFVAFFGFVVAVNAVMVTLAIRTHSGVVTDHPYEKGLAYNQVVEAKQQQEALGWKGTIDLRHSREGGNPFAIFFELKDQNGVVIYPDKTIATITRPTQQGMDFTVELKGEKTPLSYPAKGLWEVRVDAVHRGVHYQQSKRIVVE